MQNNSQRVWATRPVQQNELWCQLLSEQGFSVVSAPLLAIKPIDESHVDAEAVQAIKNIILDLDQFQKVIFVSQNAVNSAFEWFDNFWPQLPSGIEFFAVGKRTALWVQQKGVAVTAAEDAMNTDELLSLPSLTDVWGQKIVICRGRGGLTKLGDELKNRGAIVRYCELYDRCLPEDAVIAVRQLLDEQNAMERLPTDIIPVFSGETLNNLNHVLNTADIPRRDMLLVVPGKRVAELAQNLGFTRVSVAANASEAAMLDAVKATAQAL